MDYYQNFYNELSKPLVAGKRQPDGAYRVVVYATGTDFTTGIERPRLLRRTPGLYLTAGEQSALGLTPGAALRLRIYQKSSLVGRGDMLEVTL